MPKRTWNKKYTKKKSSSQLIDERIALLDREMRKTKLGEAIANSTSGLYTVTGFEPGDPAIPEIPAVPAVPPTYENVTGGLSNPDDFVWGDQGDGSNPDAPANIPSNLYTTYNGQQVAALRTPEVNHGEGVTPLAFVYHGRAISSQVLGFLGGNGGFTSVVQSGVFTTPGPYTGLQQAYLDAWNNFGKSGIYQYYTTKTIYLWGPLDCLFGSCYGGAQYSPANLSNTSTPKADRALYAYTLVIPLDGPGGNPLPNRIMTDPGAPEIPAVPGVPEGPPKPIVISRNALGDPNYYPGPATPQGDIAQMGPNQVYPLLDIIRQSPPGPTRDNAIKQLDQWAKPGSKNRDILIKLGVPLQGASMSSPQGDVAQLVPFQTRPDGTSGYNKPGDRVRDPASGKTFELKPGNSWQGGYQWKPV